MPQPRAYFEDGTPVPAEKLGEAVATGQALFEQGAAVKMRDSYGKLVDVPARDLNQAMRAGFQLESEEGLARAEAQAIHGSETGTAALEGVARGLTFGLSDQAGAYFGGDEYSRAALARQEFNPVAAGVGEVAGALAPIVLSGGTGAAAKGAATVGVLPRGAAALGAAAERGTMAGLRGLGYEGATAVSRAAAKGLSLAAAGATEGALYGAGKAISDTALHGQELTAEKVLSAAGHGALYGAGAGALLGASGSLLSSAIGKAAGKGGVKEYARTLRDESVLKALGAQKSDLNKLAGRRSADAAERRMSQLANDVFEYKFKDGRQLFKGARTPSEMADDMALAVRETGDELRALKSQIDEATVARPDLAPDLRGWLNKVDHTVISELKRSSVPSVRAQATTLEKELELIRERIAPTRTADDFAAMGVTKRGGEPVAALEQRPVTFLEADQIRRDLRSVFQPAKPASGGLPPAPPAHAAELEKIERMLAETITESGERTIKALGGDPAVWREANRKMSSLLDAEAIVNKASQNFGNRAISPSDYAMGIASGIGALATGNVGALATGAAAAVAHKLIRERGRSVVAQMADKVLKFERKLDDAAQVMAGVKQLPKAEKAKHAIAPVATEAVSVMERFRQAADAIGTMQADPRSLLQVTARVTENYADAYPDLAGGIQQTIMGDVEYLAGQLPKQLTRATSSLTPMATTSRVPESQMRKFLAVVDALDNPTDIIDQIADGKMPARQAIEALKARRPEVFNELRVKVASACLSREEELPYSRRVLLSLVFDFQGDKSLAPDFIASVQGSFVPPQPPGPPPGGGGMNVSKESAGQMELRPGPGV